LFLFSDQQVAEQRKQYRLLSDNKQSSMTQQRIGQLNELGFIWHAQEAAWMRQFNELQQFYDEHGHCNVPIRDEKFPKLGLWVKEQRRHYALRKRGKPSHLSQERYNLLNSLDFCYDAHNTTWLKHFHQLEQCHQEHGSCMIPTNHMDPKLATWVHFQRRQYRKWQRGEANHINAERIDALNKIGFVWTPRKNTVNGDDSSSSDSKTSNYSRKR
jgi:Helicase associated domain